MARRFNPVFAGDKFSASGGLGNPISNRFGAVEDEDSVDHLAQAVANSPSAEPNDELPNVHTNSNHGPATGTPERASEPFRQPGGRPVAYKAFGGDLDEDDKIIKGMKDAGYHDDKVADELVNQGFTRYHPKSIATRYNRLKRDEKKAEQERLDDELTDWHKGDDDMLKESIGYHIDKYNREMGKVKDSFYDRVAASIHIQQESANRKIAFSKNACQQRHEALQAGTAELEFELDSNQEERRARREERLQEVEQTKQRKESELQARIKQRQEKEEARRAQMAARAQRTQQRYDAARLRSMQNITKKAQVGMMTEYFRLRMLAKKDPELRERDEAKKIDILEQIRSGEMERRRQAEATLEEEDRKAENEKKSREKMYLKEAAAKKRARDEKNEKALESVESIVHMELDRILGFDSSDEVSDIDSDAIDLSVKPSRPPKTLRIASDTESSVTGEIKRKQSGRKVISTNLLEKKVYSWFPEKNPRGKLPIRGLRRLCQLRDIPPVGDRTELVFRLAQSDDAASIDELATMLRARGVSCMGQRNELMNRLALDDAGNLICGSAFYASEVDPRRKHYRTFGSLTPDGAESHLYHNGRRNTAIIIASSSEDEEDDPQQYGIDLDNEEQHDPDSVTASIEQVDADGDTSFSD